MGWSGRAPAHLAGDWRRLDERIESLSAEITRLVEQDPACQRLMTVPGIGPLTSSAMVAAIGTGDGPMAATCGWTFVGPALTIIGHGSLRAAQERDIERRREAGWRR